MSEHSFDPEVVALLQSIARDPGASLLRIPKERLLRYVGAPEDMLSPHGSYLTKAEKHLMTAYREQAARVLLEACILRLKEDPQIFSTMNPDKMSLPGRAQGVVGRLSDEPRAAEALHSLAGGAAVEISVLAVASLRLAPSELALNALALAHQQEGHIRTSMRVLGQLLDRSSSSTQRAQAWENMARAHVLRQEFKYAFECNNRASHTDENKLRYIVWCLTNALQGADEKRAVESTRRLDSYPDPADLPQIVQALELGRACGSWTPTRASQELLSSARFQLSERSAAICETFQ